MKLSEQFVDGDSLGILDLKNTPFFVWENSHELGKRRFGVSFYIDNPNLKRRANKFSKVHPIAWDLTKTEAMKLCVKVAWKKMLQRYSDL